ncbi:SusE domain-containing protein [Pedobacter sp. SD-b]|uniref:SusE domain-containing protein n=1 Tax=Pedobacter segetis TaxID=2793069 RepID=A0ABS1BFZ5_9SPHI|nr:SusE domain-containing protein [Pedobacter segetis]MBK0381781.1 SusE domain-containing protein [Pedobacter segetis]
MKKIFHKILPLGFMMLAFVACKKDEVKTIVNPGEGSTLSVSANNVVLDKSMLDKNVVTFNLTAANFGYNAAVTNVLQLAAKGSNFASPKEAILPAEALSKSYNGLDFNNLLLSLNLPTAVSSDVEVRIKSTVSSNVEPIYSNVISMKATPFALTSWIYVPGAYQGWNPATADSLISATGNGVYVGVIPFDGGNFKITPLKKWDVAYGDAGNGKISTSGGDISSGSAGAKQLTVDLNANTIKIDPLVWAVVGSGTASGWPPASGPYNELDMKYINDGKGQWKITIPLSAGGEIKFRKNHDWGTNFGGDANGNLTGDNIAVPSAGTYTITLDIPNNKYTLVKN